MKKLLFKLLIGVFLMCLVGKSVGMMIDDTIRQQDEIIEQHQNYLYESSK